jgi:DNA-binding LacI/PurR family transcriptional regulator
VKKRSKKITLKEIAEKASVSLSAVSSYLNQRQYGIRLSRSTEERILAACRDLKYVPLSETGKLLIQPEHGDFCFLLPDSVASGFDNPYFHRMIHGIEELLTRQGQSLSFGRFSGDADYGAETMELPAPLSRKKVTRVILAGLPNVSLVTRLAKSRIPIVYLGHHVDVQGSCCITANYRDASQQAITHLVSLGCRSIGVVCGPKGSPALSMNELQRGVEEVFADFDITCPPEWRFHSTLNPKGGIAAARHFLSLDDLPEAIFCFSDVQAASLMGCLIAAGVAVPGRVRVIGCNDDPIAANVVPHLTTVRFPVEQMGEEAVIQLARYLANGCFSRNEIVLPTQLVVRESSPSARLLEESCAVVSAKTALPSLVS